MKQSLDLSVRPTGYKSISRVGDILFCLSEGVNTVTEIANRCKLSKSTGSRLLKALEEANLVVQDPTDHRYYLGSFITQIYSNPTAAHMDLVLKAAEEMKHLSEATGETVFLGVIVGIQYIRLNEITCKHELRVVSAESCDLMGPQFIGATAKVLLSQLDAEALKLAMKSLDSALLNNNPTDEEKFIAELLQIRRQGYAISYGERVAGTVSMSAPIKNYTFPAALSILGPEIRLRPRGADLIEKLTQSARLISNNIAEYLQVEERTTSR